jgi:hypothetical protein
MARPKGAPALIPGRASATDLTAVSGLSGLTGQRLVDVGRATLDAGESYVQSWRDLEPLVRTLTEKVKTHVDSVDVQGEEAAKLLSLCASVLQKVGAAGQGMLRSTEGLTRLAMLLEGPKVERPHPQKMTEGQLASIVLTVAKKIAKETGACPICAELPKDVTPEPAHDA